jgi:hypothetical protein
MKLDPDIRKALRSLTKTYIIEKKKDHYYALFETGERVIIAGNHGRLGRWELKRTLSDLDKVGG